jgi:hypothetical protein
MGGSENPECFGCFREQLAWSDVRGYASLGELLASGDSWHDNGRGHLEIWPYDPFACVFFAQPRATRRDSDP